MYTEFFEFRGRPFQLTPDTRFFFESRTHKKAISYLTYGLHQREGFVVVTGEVGAGKTMLIDYLLSRLDLSQYRVAKIVTTQVEADDLLRMIAAAFEISVPGAAKSSLISELRDFFESSNAGNIRPLLIVDEVQNLSLSALEELRMLSNFQQDGKPLVQVFLLGQEEFRATLLSSEFEQLRQRVIATYHLNPLDEEETRTYIEHRLGRVAWNEDPKFADAAFGRIFVFTAGVPRRINNLCDRVMLYAFLEECHEIDAEVIRIVAEEIGTDKAEVLAESRNWRRYDLPSELVPRLWNGRYRGQEQKWLALRFLGADADMTVRDLERGRATMSLVAGSPIMVDGQVTGSGGTLLVTEAGEAAARASGLLHPSSAITSLGMSALE